MKLGNILDKIAKRWQRKGLPEAKKETEAAKYLGPKKVRKSKPNSATRKYRRRRSRVNAIASKSRRRNRLRGQGRVLR